MYYPYENHTVNATPTERLQQHPLVFAMNRTHYVFFLWRLHLAPPSYPGQSTTGKAEQQVRKASHYGSKQQ